MKRVWYHSSCFDGYGAAWAASKSLGRGDGVVYKACSHKTKAEIPEFNPGDKIYIVDFSFPRPDLLGIKDQLGPDGSLLVLDHHVTAQEELEGLDFCVFDMKRSGAGMAWDHFMNTITRPVMINLIEDRDLWQFRFQATQPFHSYMRSQPFDFEVWDQVAHTMDTDPQSIVLQGESILRFTETEVKRICNKATVTEILGHPAAVVNATGFWSEVGHLLLDEYPQAAFAASFGFLPTGEVLWSLRGRKDGLAVSEIAKHFGGGGHAQASGMRTKSLEEVFTKWKT